MAEMTVEQQQALAMAQARLRLQQQPSLGTPTLGGFVSNVGSSAANLAGGIAHMVTHPIDTATTMLDVGAGALQNVLPKALVDFINSGDSPEKAAANQRAVNAANAMGGIFKDKYGSWEKIKNTLYTDPVGAAADLSILFTGGGAAATRLATASRGPIVAGTIAGLPGMEAAATASGALRTAGQALSTAGQYTNPLSAVMPIARAAGAAATTIPGVTQAVDVAKSTAKTVAGAGYNIIEPMLPGGAEAIKHRATIAAFSSDPFKGAPDIAKMNQAISMLESGATIEQAAVQLNSPGLAAMAKTSQNANVALAGLYSARDAALRESQVNRLGGAAENLNALSQANLPPSAGSLDLPRRAVDVSVAQEQAALAARQAARADEIAKQQQAAESALAQQQSDLAASVVKPRQMEVGQTLTTERKALETKARTEVVAPAYTAAFTKAPESFSFAPVETAAKKLAADPSTKLNPQIAPYTTEILRLYTPDAPPAVPAAWQALYAKQKGALPATPVSAKVTLEEADKLIKALNTDLAAIRGNTDSASNMTRKNLVELKTAAEQAIESGVSKEAADLYKNARTLHRTKVVEPFLKGWVANLEREGATGTQIITPSAVTKKILSTEEDAIRAVAAFSESPIAMQAIKTGIEGAYREAVITGKTSHADWMSTHEFQLAALDKAGLKLTQRLETIGERAQKLEQTAAELTTASKGIPKTVAAEFSVENAALATVAKDLKFSTTKDLRSAAVKDEATMNQVLQRMDTPAKAALARGVMQDAMAAKDPLAYLTTNERTVMTALRAADPNTATRIMADAREILRIRSLIETAQKARPVNAMGTEQRVADLTQGLPEVRAAVQKIQTEINQGVSFDKLAARGVAAGGGVGTLATESVGPALASLSHSMSLVNFVMRRLKGLTDDKLAAQIGVELSNSPAAAAMIAKARDTATPKIAPPKTPGQWPKSVAPGAIMLNQLVPQNNQNSLPR